MNSRTQTQTAQVRKLELVNPKPFNLDEARVKLAKLEDIMREKKRAWLDSVNEFSALDLQIEAIIKKPCTVYQFPVKSRKAVAAKRVAA